jgi:hypothetical protein
MKEKFTATGAAYPLMRALFGEELIRATAVGFVWGLMTAAVLDLTDVHVCVGECDGAGYDIVGERK